MNHFSWRGEPITDIRAWAAERNEPIVRLEQVTWQMAPNGAAYEAREVIEMPRCFAEALPSAEFKPGLQVTRQVLA